MADLPLAALRLKVTLQRVDESVVVASPLPLHGGRLGLILSGKRLHRYRGLVRNDDARPGTPTESWDRRVALRELRQALLQRALRVEQQAVDACQREGIVAARWCAMALERERRQQRSEVVAR